MSKDNKFTRPVTMKDIASRANTSTNTVSKALRNHPQVSKKKRLEILGLADEMGYIPNNAARTLRQRRSRLIGIVVGDNTNSYFAELIKAAQHKLKLHNYRLITFNNFENVEDEVQFIREMCSLDVAGVLLSPAMGNAESSQILRRFNVPFVFMSRTPENTPASYVVANDERAAYLATIHLLETGQNPIGFINFFKDFITARLRFQGYVRALRESGFSPDPALVVEGCTDRRDGYCAMQTLMERLEPPFSVVCYSDYIATGALSAAREKNLKIPEDVRVIGIDDSDVLLNSVLSLSSVKIPVTEMAERAVDILVDSIQNRLKDEFVSKAKQIVLEPELVIRGSTGCIMQDTNNISPNEPYFFRYL